MLPSRVAFFALCLLSGNSAPSEAMESLFYVAENFFRNEFHFSAFCRAFFAHVGSMLIEKKGPHKEKNVLCLFEKMENDLRSAFAFCKNLEWQQ